MLRTDGIPPKLTNLECQSLLCQQYWYRGELQQEVDMLLLKVNGCWHQLYFEEGIVFWRLQEGVPEVSEAQRGDPFSYPLIDLGEKYALKQSLISDCITEPLLDGVRVSLLFEGKGSLIVKHRDDTTSLAFVKGYC